MGFQTKNKFNSAMNANKRRSSLRKAAPVEDDATTTNQATVKQQIKRRISFSGKKFVREFVNTKETNNWDDSYEVSEHNAEDSTGSRSVAGSGPLSSVSQDKENVPLPGHHERSVTDSILNLQTSVDVTMLPGETRISSLRNASNITSICLSSEERKVLQSSLYDHRAMDKTYDLMSQSLITRIQSQTSNLEDPSFEQPPIERGKSVNTPVAKGISDSFMDITPLGFAVPAPAPAPAVSASTAVPAPTPVAAPAPPPPAQQSFMDLEDDSMMREMREFTKKEKKTPLQKPLFMDIEEAARETKNKTQHGPVDISFDCPLNVSENRDRSPSNSFESNNSTINFIKDESMLIPFDMISGKNISKKLNFRQLNDELEAGKIQLFPNGPKTPTTDRKTTKNRFWQGLEGEDNSPRKDIRSIKPRATLNFSENMMMSPAPTSPNRKENDKLKVMDDKRKYRFSQADEMMLDNTNFLAHAKLGDETQSRNNSKNSTRRETTYDNSELNLEYPINSQSFHPIPSSKPRQTVCKAEEMQQDQLELPAISGVKAVPPRRTLHLNESMDQEATKSMHLRKEIAVTTEKTVYEKSTISQENARKGTVWACTKTKRRETLLMQESMDITSPCKDLHLEPTSAPAVNVQSKKNHTLYLAEPLEEEEVKGSEIFPLTNISPNEIKSKPRQTMLLEEPMDEGSDMIDPPVFNSKRKTLHLAEPLEEEEVIPDRLLPTKTFPHQEKKSKARQTLLLEEPMEEEMFNKKNEPEDKIFPVKNILSNQGKKSNARQTLLLEEPMEEDPFLEDPFAAKSRQTLTSSEPIGEDKCIPQLKNKSIVLRKTFDKSTAPQRQKSRHTLIMSEPIEEEQVASIQCREQSRLKSRSTLLLHEPVEQDFAPEKDDNSVGQHRPKPRHTLIMSEPIEEDVEQPRPESFSVFMDSHTDNKVPTNKANSPTYKASRTLLMSDPIDEDVTELKSKGQTKEPLSEVGHKNTTSNRSLRSRSTLQMSESIGDAHKSIAHKNDHSHYKSRNTKLMEESFGEMTIKSDSRPSKSRQTILTAESIEEDEEIYKSMDNNNKPSKLMSNRTKFMEESIMEIESEKPVKSSKPRQTLHVAEPIEEDEEIYKSMANNNEPFKLMSNRTKFMEESIMEIESEKPVKSSKPRQTLHVAEPIGEDEEINKSMPNNNEPCRLMSNRTKFMEESTTEIESKKPVQPSKPRQTLLVAEPIEEDEEIHKKPKNHMVSHFVEESMQEMRTKVNGQTRRQTLINAEPIEEDLELPNPMQNAMEQSLQESRLTDQSSKNRSSKSRLTLVMAEPIEEDSEPVKPRNHYKSQHHPKPRNTLLTHEPIQEDFVAGTGENSLGPQTSKHRKTLLMAEPIEEDTSFYNKSKSNNNSGYNLQKKNTSHSRGYTSSKSRQTLLIPEPIEEDDISCGNYQETKNVTGITLPSAESDKASVPPPLDVNSKHFSGDENFKCIDESRKTRNTLVRAQSIEIEKDAIPTAQASKRHTLLLSEPMDEDEEVPGQNYPTNEKQLPEKPKKGVLNGLKETVFGNSLEREEGAVPSKAKALQTMLITPVPNTRILSRISQFTTYTPGMSLTEFEDQEEISKIPVSEKKLVTSQRKQFSTYQQQQMELVADASGIGTPLRHAALKRLPFHLTPNLPESKKRHTHLLTDSNMEITMEEEQEGAWGTTKPMLEAGTSKCRRTFTVNPMDASVQAVRDFHPAMTELNKKSSLDMLELSTKLVYNTDLDDKPITISDVTNYFQQQKEMQRRSSERESGSSNERTFRSYAATNLKFINLTGNTTTFAGAQDVDGEQKEPSIEIDNVRLSLVSTLAEETDDEGVEEEEECQEEHPPKTELCEDQPVVIAGSSRSCKKCTNCNQSLSETKLSNDSFVLPHKKLWDFSRQQQRLSIIRQKPTMKEVNLYWELEEQNRMSRCHETDDSMDQSRVEDEPTPWDKATLLDLCKIRVGPPKAIDRPTESFFERLKCLLAEQQPNWICDFQRKISQQMIFYHRLLTTFRIVVNYKIEDMAGESAISVCFIELDNEVITRKEHWTSGEHLLNFQLSLRLPLNLIDAIEGSDETAFLKFLKHIDQKVVEIKQTFHSLLTVLTEKRARLLREANRTIVKKIVRKCIEDEPLVRLEKTSFVIEVSNIEEVSFMDILRPELHLFNENIQYLPKGIAFLEAFLTNPEQYLKK
ncbi:uncharacterized protein LOC119552923 [Drosophila subpulchrella]|uniref:uncharacterized protein LOC119552923 n=1 Tax=Drosophila subpulchrella TaxID=1486046 RepID=UPI0018A129A8|nr:uncharacterized protein LOC119552923 [Drosophila subpulchrella]